MTEPAAEFTYDEVLAALDRVRVEVERSRRESFGAFGIDVDCSWPASRLFHDHSRLGPHWRPELSVAEVEQLTADRSYRRYDGATMKALPRPEMPSAPLEQVIRRRRSACGFGADPIDTADIAKILELSAGVTDDERFRRACPSGGALYPIETYVLSVNVTDLPCGTYHYAAAEHGLEVLAEGYGTSLSAALPPALAEAPAAAAIVLSAVFGRTQAKYLERGYRFALLEAGHIAQNILLVATALDLGAVSVGGFWDDPMNDVFGFDGVEEAAVYCVLIGTRINAYG